MYLKETAYNIVLNVCSQLSSYDGILVISVITQKKEKINAIHFLKNVSIFAICMHMEIINYIGIQYIIEAIEWNSYL